ncbi:hypothetical protein [Effusibacillus pohliae]|uniref:hypothetical protein n=1 Tax=Effusibacillus pohliae TaxID=232270 RepID=UPI00036B1C14|nr:hypothetical protein [Effusibacillus pohliae]
MDQERQTAADEPTIAPGADEWDKEASRRDVERGDFTTVTKLSYDEVDPTRK